MGSPDQHKSGQKPLISFRYMFLSIGLSLLGMAVVIYLTYSPGILEDLKPKRMPGLVIAFGVTFLRVWFSAARIRYLAGNAVDWNASLRIALTWDFASAITPSTIGGAPVATYIMSKEGIKLGRSSGIMLYGVLMDQFWYILAVPILLITGIFLEVIPSEIGWFGAATMILIYTGLILYGLLLTYGLLMNPNGLKRLIKRIFLLSFLKRYFRKAYAEADHLEEYSVTLKKKPFGFFAKAFFLTAMTWLCRIALPPIVILSLLPVDEVLLILRSLAMSLASLVIPTPGGSGGVEGLFAIFFGPLMARKSFIGLAVFVWRVITYYISIGLGVMAMMWYVTKNGEVKNGDQ